MSHFIMNMFVVNIKCSSKTQVQTAYKENRRYLFCAKAIYKTQAETGKIKGHYLNATAGTCAEMDQMIV